MGIDNMTVEEIFQTIDKKVQEDSSIIKDLKASYMFHITGDDGGDYSAIFDDGHVTITNEIKDDAECKITLSSENFRKMIQGNLNSAAAFMTGKLKVKGNMGLALKLESILKKLA